MIGHRIRQSVEGSGGRCNQVSILPSPTKTQLGRNGQFVRCFKIAGCRGTIHFKITINKIKVNQLITLAKEQTPV